MAVITPVLLAMLLGVIEFGRVFMVQETITNACREACRVAVLQGTTEAEVRSRFNEAMAATGLTVADDMLQITPATADNPVVTVAASINYDDVSLVGGYLGLNGGKLGSTCSMRKEGLW